MIRPSLAAMAAAATLVLAACTHEPGDEQILVDRAALTVQDMMNQRVSQDPRSLLEKSKAVMICPRSFKASFIVGAEGASCVLLARGGNGTWSYPAFFGLSSGSVGFQIGIQDSQIMLVILTQKGLNAVLDSQFKFGASASIAIATVGASVQGATTAAVGADIVAFAEARGLFGGVSLEGSILSSRSEWNEGYYRQRTGARPIVIQMQYSNPGADPLREVLTRYGGTPREAEPGTAPVHPPQQPQPGYAPAYPPNQVQAAPRPAQPQATPPGYLPAYPAGQPVSQPTPAPIGGRPPIQEQTLPPPAR